MGWEDDPVASGGAKSPWDADPVAGERQPETNIWSGFSKEGVEKLGTAATDVVRSVAEGAMMGYADEFGAGMNALLGQGTYEENLAAEEARSAEIHPGIAIPGEIAGGVATATVTGPAAAATRLGQTFKQLPGWVQASGLGALWSGLYSSGKAKEGKRVEEGIEGAKIGAIAGPVVHGAIKGVQAVRGLRKAKTMPEEKAAQLLAKKLIEDDTTPNKVRVRLRTLGPQATIMDAAGENVVGLTRAIAALPGPAKNKVIKVLWERSQKESERIQKDVTRNLGPGDYLAAEDKFLEKLSSNARDAYTRAYQGNPVVTSRNLELMLKTPIMQKALKEAAELAGIERAAGTAKWLGPVDKELTEMANYAASVGLMARPDRPGVAKGLSLETWDYLKKGIDSILDKPAYRNELTGKLNKKGFVVNKLRKSLVNLLDKHTGGDKSLYKTARGQYESNAEAVNALREGKGFLRQSPEQIRKSLGDLSKAGQAAYRNGASRAVMDVVEGVPDGASAARRLFNKSASRKRLEAVFPTPKGFREFTQKMLAEQRFSDVKGMIGSGSRTAPMAAEMQEVEKAAGSAGAILGTKVPGAHALVASRIGREYAIKFFRAFRGSHSETDRAMARMLVSRSKADQERALGMIEAMYKQEKGQVATQIGPKERAAIIGVSQQTP